MDHDLVSEQLSNVLQCQIRGLFDEEVDDNCRYDIARKPHHVIPPSDVLEGESSGRRVSDSAHKVREEGQSDSFSANYCRENLGTPDELRRVEEHSVAGSVHKDKEECGCQARLVARADILFLKQSFCQETACCCGEANDYRRRSIRYRALQRKGYG